MTYLFIRHEVQDYDRWRESFEAHEQPRRQAGLRTEGIFQGSDDPNDVVLVFKVDDEERARQFLQSEELRQRLQQSGVSRGPWVHFMKQPVVARV